MSATTDTFARCVDVLADMLDDDGASGEALASRVHLSRSHFDRLVSAAAGEPPACAGWARPRNAPRIRGAARQVLSGGWSSRAPTTT